MTQLLIFEESSTEKLKREIERIQEQCEKTRKHTYIKLAALNKLAEELAEQVEILNRNTCRGA